MTHDHPFQQITNKQELIEHLLTEHNDTVFGGRADLVQEPMRVLAESHRYGHDGPAVTKADVDRLVREYNSLPAGPAKRAAYRKMLKASTEAAKSRPRLPILEGLMNEALGGGR